MSYVYMLIDSRNNTPFYVGKGNGDRCNFHVKEAIYYKKRKSLKLSKIRSILNDGHEVTVVKVEDNVSDEMAMDFECLLISEMRSHGFELTNMTDGGDGALGYKHSESHKEYMSTLQKGRVISESHKLKMRKPKSDEGRANIAKARKESTYIPSTETKLKISLALKSRISPMKGRKQTEEARQKMSVLRKGIKKPRVFCPHCEKDIAVNTASRWHFDNCKEKR